MSFNLRAWRFDNGVSVRTLAQRSGVARATIVRIENGEMPEAPVAHKLSQVIGKRASELWLTPTTPDDEPSERAA